MQKITLTKTQHTLLTNIIHQKTSPQQLVFRAKIILAYVEIDAKQAVADQQQITRDTVYRWIKRWQSVTEELSRLEATYTAGQLSESLYQRALAALLHDAPRPGHPTTFTEDEKQKIIALASEKPETVGVPITHWTHKLLRDTIIARGIVPTISSAQVGRFLKQGHPAASQG